MVLLIPTVLVAGVVTQTAGAAALGFTFDNALYAAAGAFFTFLKALASHTQCTWSRRTLVSVIIGAVSSVLFVAAFPKVPILGDELASLSPVVKACAAGLLSFVTDWLIVVVAWRNRLFKAAGIDAAEGVAKP